MRKLTAALGRPLEERNTLYRNHLIPMDPVT